MEQESSPSHARRFVREWRKALKGQSYSVNLFHHYQALVFANDPLILECVKDPETCTGGSFRESSLTMFNAMARLFTFIRMGRLTTLGDAPGWPREFTLATYANYRYLLSKDGEGRFEKVRQLQKRFHGWIRNVTIRKKAKSVQLLAERGTKRTRRRNPEAEAEALAGLAPPPSAKRAAGIATPTETQTCDLEVTGDFIRRAKALYDRETGRHGKEVGGYATVNDLRQLVDVVKTADGDTGRVRLRGHTLVRFHTHPQHGAGDLRVNPFWDTSSNFPSAQDLVNHVRGHAKGTRWSDLILQAQGMLFYCQDRGFGVRYTENMIRHLRADPTRAAELVTVNRLRRGLNAPGATVDDLMMLTPRDLSLTVVLVHITLRALYLLGEISLSQYYQGLQSGKGRTLDELLFHKRRPDVGPVYQFFFEMVLKYAQSSHSRVIDLRDYQGRMLSRKYEDFQAMARDAEKLSDEAEAAEEQGKDLAPITERAFARIERFFRDVGARVDEGFLFQAFLQDHYDSLFRFVRWYPWHSFSLEGDLRGLL